MRICSSCVLPETYPGIIFDARGVCNHCLNYRGRTNPEVRKHEYHRKFEELVGRYKGRARYDAVMSYSGGKDSTYVLFLLAREVGLKVLALTLDNCFLPEQTFANIDSVTARLGIDHEFIKPRFELLKKIFVGCSRKDIFPRTTLTRASTICTACMAMVKFSTLRIAIEREIPLIIFGWSPGQIPLASSIMKNTPQLCRLRQNTLLKPLVGLAGDEVAGYFLQEDHFRRSRDYPYSVSPLAFFDYEEKEILERARQLGWKAPEEVDANSTNCLLNSFANSVHKKRHGFHPYSFELAKLVREGYMTRTSALAKLNKAEFPQTIAAVKQKLGLDDF